MKQNVIRGRAAYAGMSVGALAEKTGISRATMQNRMSAPEGFKLWELAAISQAVGGLSISDLKALGIKVRGME